jgi:4-carboxymuconolactone decarboxylase
MMRWSNLRIYGLTNLSVILCVLTVAPSTLNAQDRMPPIPADKLTEAQKKAIADFQEARGTADIGGPFVPMLRSPEVMSRARAMGDYLRYKSALPPNLSEFVILLTARQWTQQYEWDTHYSIALKAGVSQAALAAIAEGRRPSSMTMDEEILYDFCDELQRNKSVSDGTYARMLTRFGDKGVIDTTGIVGYYTVLAMMMNVAQTPAQAASEAPKLR